MKESVRNLRVKIDGLSQLTKELKPIMNIHVRDGKKTNIKEIEKCYDSLILAKAWLGKVLGELGEETPYVNDGNRKTVEDIEPTADKAYEGIFTRNSEGKLIKTPLAFVNEGYGTEENPSSIKWKDLNHIEKVDWLRTEIQETINTLVVLLQNESKIKTFYDFSYQHLCEARFWLGFELQKIRENG